MGLTHVIWMRGLKKTQVRWKIKNKNTRMFFEHGYTFQYLNVVSQIFVKYTGVHASSVPKYMATVVVPIAQQV